MVMLRSEGRLNQDNCIVMEPQPEDLHKVQDSADKFKPEDFLM